MLTLLLTLTYIPNPNFAITLRQLQMYYYAISHDVIGR